MNLKKNVLITGGAGYIGSVVVTKLVENDYKVIVIDDLRDGNRKAVHSAAIFYKFDFGDINKLKKVFETHNIHSVLHLAASANVPDSVENPREYYINNLENTLNLLNVMQNYNIKNIIFSSTAAVYGEPQYNPIDENHPTLPINPYGWSKLFAEQIIKDYSLAYNIKYIIFRYFCAAGATNKNGESRSYESHLIPIVLDTILGNRNDMSVYGNDYKTIDGTGVRDYIHVEDIAEAHILALKNIKLNTNQILNLGSNSSHSVLQVIDKAERLLNKNVNFCIDKPRPGDPGTLTTTCEKAFKTLDWAPKNNLNDIIASAFEWRKNPLY